MKTARAVPALIVSSLLAVALAGCGPSGPSAPTESAAPATATETPTADPTPTESPAVLAAECTDLLDGATLTSMAASSFPLLNPVDTSSYVDKIRGEGSINAVFVDNGGLLCLTSNGYSVGELFGYSPITPAQATAQQEVLLDRGYTATAYLGGDLYSQLTPSDDVVFEYLFAGGYWFCSKTLDRLDETIANSGVPLSP